MPQSVYVRGDSSVKRSTFLGSGRCYTEARSFGDFYCRLRIFLLTDAVSNSSSGWVFDELERISIKRWLSDRVQEILRRTTENSIMIVSGELNYDYPNASTASTILNSGPTGDRLSASRHGLFTPRKEPRYAWNGRLKWSGIFGEN